MKNLQRLFASMILTFLLSISTLAGDGIIHTLITGPSSPPASVATNNMFAADGIISTGVTSSDPVAEIALGVLQSVLALF
jgi:hypothetical protein